MFKQFILIFAMILLALPSAFGMINQSFSAENFTAPTGGCSIQGTKAVCVGAGDMKFVNNIGFNTSTNTNSWSCEFYNVTMYDGGLEPTFIRFYHDNSSVLPRYSIRGHSAIGQYIF